MKREIIKPTTAFEKSNTFFAVSLIDQITNIQEGSQSDLGRQPLSYDSSDDPSDIDPIFDIRNQNKIVIKRLADDRKDYENAQAAIAADALKSEQALKSANSNPNTSSDVTP